MAECGRGVRLEAGGRSRRMRQVNGLTMSGGLAKSTGRGEAGGGQQAARAAVTVRIEGLLLLVLRPTTGQVARILRNVAYCTTLDYNLYNAAHL